MLGRQLGDELRRFRGAAGLTTAIAAEALDCTKGKISRIDNGHVPVPTPDLVALMKAYGVTDQAARERLEALTRRANRRRRDGWWHQYADVLSDTFRDQIELTVQVLPFERGAHSGMFGPYLLLSFPQVSSLDLALSETPTGNIWTEREPEVARYRALFDDARTAALPQTESLALIHRIAKEHQQ
ncbi:helix-turn-helix domain-containing protein [Streptomyces sp. NBC_01108]|uniref:Scr1 family TA system antitoxin-like transcriptional regulator n=1 Tax=Streptomyces sp. NBC_01108 TaxID=2903751 RepID=UPI0038736AB6|nr:helix-turn-helix domain-containing protein [Streptomyces sp. NBC_01108]